MREGWYRDQYFILFDGDEEQEATLRYAIADRLPGFVVVGLRGWDDFILRNATGAFFTVPTVPAIARYLESLAGPPPCLERDAFRAGLIKWYVRPLIFGGSPELEENTVWVDQQQHAELVVWWNRKYEEVAGVNSSWR